MMKEMRSFEDMMAKLEAGTPPAPDSGFLGAQLSPEMAQMVLIPVSWEVTTSYGGGTAQGPQAIIKASHQLDLEDAAFGQPYRAGIAFLPADEEIESLNNRCRPAATRVIEALGRDEEDAVALAMVNEASAELNGRIYEQARKQLQRGKVVAVVGGDHASPYGLIKALAEQGDSFGILHFDAHHDLRRAYEGFHYSHASIFYNVMEHFDLVRHLVQVGIRDYSRAERHYSQSLGARSSCFYARDLFAMKADGMHFSAICDQIIEKLPKRVYLSFDIDALDPPYCPNTGTPVPGGLSFDEACYLLEKLAASGKKIIGFDLCEVAPGVEGDEWDANVGARILYKLCGTTLRSNGLC
jgi:agmatinase